MKKTAAVTRSVGKRVRIDLGVCPVCAPHSGHAPGECCDLRETTKTCRCAHESRPGMSEFIVRGMKKEYGYFRRRVGIGPQFGAPRDEAYRFATQIELREEMASWPVMAEVGCKIESVDIRMAAPFVKWAGGKRGSIEEMLKHVPATYGTFFEPFVGGGALFYALQPERAVLGDSNDKLMTAYTIVRDSVEDLIRQLSRITDTAKNFAYIREQFNGGRFNSPATGAAWLIFLNKTCFNGLYRVNKLGNFNVPYDGTRIGKRTICDDVNLRLCAKALKGVELFAGDFEKLALRARKGDFVYFDPPYVPVGGYADFTEYVMGGFGPEEQARLVAVAKRLKARGVHVLLSNADVPEVRRLYKGFKLHEVQARRSINSKATNRGKVGELLIT